MSALDQVMAHLDRLGSNTGERSSSAKVKKIMITDPNGSHIAFADAIDQSMARWRRGGTRPIMEERLSIVSSVRSLREPL